MTHEEFREKMCSRCIHYGEKCEENCITVETQSKENEPPVKRIWCKNYKKWSDYIARSFKLQDWRDGRDGEG